MLSRPEALAFCLAASTSPIVACVVFGSARQWVFVAAVAYIAAFAFGAPLFAYLRHRGWLLASRSLVSALVAGVIASLLVATLVLVAFPPRDFLANPGPTLFVFGFSVAWGLGLGLIAGVALLALLRVGGPAGTGVFSLERLWRRG